MGAASRPAADVENRPDGLGSLLHVEQAEVAGTLGLGPGVCLDAGPGVVDRERDARAGRGIAHDDRRAPVLDGIRQRFLGDAEEGELDIRWRPGAIRALEADLATGQPL